MKGRKEEKEIERKTREVQKLLSRKKNPIIQERWRTRASSQQTWHPKVYKTRIQRLHGAREQEPRQEAQRQHGHGSRVLWCNLVVYFKFHKFFKKITKYSNGEREREREHRTHNFFLSFLPFVFYIVSSPWRLTHIYNKLRDTSIYINLSSQNPRSAIAALKREAKTHWQHLTSKVSGDTKKRRGGWVGFGAGGWGGPGGEDRVIRSCHRFSFFVCVFVEK